MPKGKPRSLFPHLYKGEAPAPGGGGKSPSAPEIRTPITQMLSPEKEEDFLSNLPDSTASETPIMEEAPAPKRTRKPKAEEAPAPVDERMKRISSRMYSLGGTETLEAAFKLTGKPLNEDEHQEVDDTFYAISKKLVPSDGGEPPWWLVLLYVVVLGARLIGMRTEAGKALSGVFVSDTTKTVKDATEKKESPAPAAPAPAAPTLPSRPSDSAIESAARLAEGAM